MRIPGQPKVLLVNRCVIKDAEGKKVLIIKRSMADRHNAGLWEFPGGKLAIGQDISHALEYEVLEETGLLISSEESQVKFADSYVIGTGPYRGLTYVVLFGVAHVIGGDVKLSAEHEDFAWETYEKALEYDLAPESRKALIVLGKSTK